MMSDVEITTICAGDSITVETADDVDECTLKEGDEFDSFNEFRAKFNRWTKDSNIHWVQGSSRTNATANRNYVNNSNKVLHDRFIYRYVIYTCQHGGKKKRSKARGIRAHQRSMKFDCPATVLVSVDPVKDKLVVRRVMNEHNHEVSRSMFLRYLRPRSLDYGTMQIVADQLLNGQSARDTLSHLHQMGGPYTAMTMKGVHNIRSKIKREQLVAYGLEPAVRKMSAKLTNSAELASAGHAETVDSSKLTTASVHGELTTASIHGVADTPDAEKSEPSLADTTCHASGPTSPPTSSSPASSATPWLTIARHNESEFTEMTRRLIPPLDYDRHKGQAGRLAVIGGCKEYTGAPYFAAITMLKVGADLAHVICANEAAPVIKSYSPELIVHPILDQPGGVAEICQTWLPKMHAVVIGPGLGRDLQLLANVRVIIHAIKRLNLPMVIDADGVHLVSNHIEMIRGYRSAILTPNVVEYANLYKAVLGKPNVDNSINGVVELSRALDHVTIVRKGPEDIVTDGHEVVCCATEGSPRRCGGQGDLLSGSMGVFSYWSQLCQKDSQEVFSAPLCAACAACHVTRLCARTAFARIHRATTTTDLIASIGECMYAIEDSQGEI